MATIFAKIKSSCAALKIANRGIARSHTSPVLQNSRAIRRIVKKYHDL
jgi:hypothetical protein